MVTDASINSIRPRCRYAARVRGLLVRVGIDKTAGGWNAPVDPDSLEFVYVPIPEARDQQFHPGLATTYAGVSAALAAFGPRALDGTALPEALASRASHLDPDFDQLTYGDVGPGRGRSLCEFEAGDVVVFFAGLRPVRPCQHRLLYALIGLYRVKEILRAGDVPRARWPENAHTRRKEFRATDVIVRADPSASGRLRRCIPVGEFRDRAYRVRRDVLDAWGGLSARDGYVQRSAVPPRFLDPRKFLAWFESNSPELVRANDPGSPRGSCTMPRMANVPELLTASKIASQLKVADTKVKKAIAELGLKPAAKKGVCSYYAAGDVPKIKKALK